MVLLKINIFGDRGGCLVRRPTLLAALCAALGLVLSLSIAPPRAHAQTIVATVNGTPITSLDVEQRMKMLRVLRKPASRDAAMQSLIDDNLRLDETSKYKIRASDAEIGQQIAREATHLNMTPEALVAALHGAGVSDSHIKDHFAAAHTFHLLMQAYNKGVEASESQIRAELAKEGGKAAAGMEYGIRQVVFTISPPTSLEKVNNRMHEAEQLRARFTDCASGLPLARGLEDVAVKEEIRRNASQLSQPIRQLLDKTPPGHLTPPQRTAEGVEMLAVCSKSASRDDSSVRAAISERIISAELDAEGEKRLQELRSHAVIVKK
jgi:peptidyl-prolyl cis-trans isomerase SurA